MIVLIDCRGVDGLYQRLLRIEPYGQNVRLIVRDPNISGNIVDIEVTAADARGLGAALTALTTPERT